MCLSLFVCRAWSDVCSASWASLLDFISIITILLFQMVIMHAPAPARYRNWRVHSVMAMAKP